MKFFNTGLICTPERFILCVNYGAEGTGDRGT